MTAASTPTVPVQPPESPPPKSRKGIKIAAAVVGALAVIVLAVSLGTALGGRGKTASQPARPSVARYPNAASLVTAMNRHGDTCAGVSYTGSSLAKCQGSTMVLTFSSSQATHARIVSVAHATLALASDTGKTEAAVVGPNWLVIGAPAFAGKVQHGLGGQYLGPGASPAAPSSPPPAAAPAPNPQGTYSGSCNYLLGSSPATGTAVAVGEIDLTNTGNIGEVTKARITWPQEGFAPLRETRTVHVAAGTTKRVSFSMPLSSNQISALQAWQTGHNYADGCTYRATITGTYGTAH